MGTASLLSFVTVVLGFATCFAAIHIPLEPEIDPPEILSETGVLAENLVDYRINQALWVDFAAKKRRLFLPEGTQIQFSPTNSYQFPVGTVFVKHFEMEISKGIFRNVETRVLVRKNGEPEKWVGYTYLWNGNDAKLVDGRSNPEVLLEIDNSAPGGARAQKFKVPSRRQCLQCHNESVGYVRSFNTRQLNREEQLDELNQKNIFNQQLEPSAHYEKFAAITDESIAQETRVRTYLDVNCSHCHNPGPAAMCNFTGLDFRYDYFSPEALVISGHLTKGHAADSAIFQRMSSVQQGIRMPFIGSALRDEAALSVVEGWINSLHE